MASSRSLRSLIASYCCRRCSEALLSDVCNMATSRLRAFTSSMAPKSLASRSANAAHSATGFRRRRKKRKSASTVSAVVSSAENTACCHTTARNWTSPCKSMRTRVQPASTPISTGAQTSMRPVWSSLTSMSFTAMSAGGVCTPRS